jgi:hypothetical protein
VQVDPNVNKVYVKSYSPVADQYLTDADSQFNFNLNLQDRFGLPDHGGTTGSITFRQGLNGYSGTVETMISKANPGTNYSSDTSVIIDGDYDGDKTQALIRFNTLFGAGAIPDGAQIDHAELRFHTSDLTNAASNNTIRLYRMIRGWVAGSVTWNSVDDGISTDGLEAILGENGGLVPDVRDGYITFDVTESLAAWAAGAPNNGWLLVSGGNDAWRWDASEASTGADRPRLVVDYRTDTLGPVPEPASLAMVSAFGLLLSRRRRRRSA